VRPSSTHKLKEGRGLQPGRFSSRVDREVLARRARGRAVPVLFAGIDDDHVARVERKLVALTVDNDAYAAQSVEHLDIVVFVPVGSGTLTKRDAVDPYGQPVGTAEQRLHQRREHEVVFVSGAVGPAGMVDGFHLGCREGLEGRPPRPATMSRWCANGKPATPSIQLDACESSIYLSMASPLKLPH